ncbi:unnamed protein product [Cunninghamella blakesleeana]
MPSPVGFSESKHYGDDTIYYVDWLSNDDSFPTLGQTTSKVISTHDWEKIDYLKEQQTQQYVDVAINAQDTLADVNEYHPFPSIHPQQQKALSKKNKKNGNQGDSDESDDDYKYDEIDNDIDPYYAIYQHYKSTSPHAQRGTNNYMRQMKETILQHLDSLDELTLREIHQLISGSSFAPYKSQEQRMRPNIYKKDPLKHSLEEDFNIKSYRYKHQKKSKADIDYDYDY